MYLDRGYTLHGLAGARRIVAALFIGLFSCSFAQAAETRVYLLRGWFGVFSTGMDELAAELNAQGAEAEAIGHLSWKATVSRLFSLGLQARPAPASGGTLPGREQRDRNGPIARNSQNCR